MVDEDTQPSEAPDGQEPEQPSLELPALLGGRKRPSRRTSSKPVKQAESVVTEKPVKVEKPAKPAKPAKPVGPVGAEKPARTPKSFKPLKAPKEAKQPKEPKPAKERRERSPILVGRVGAIVTGLVVGGILLGLTVLGFQGCEAIQGTDSCGTAPGMGFLIVIFALAVVGGRFLLKLFGVPDPGSTSFLAVGLTSVVALLFFIDVLDTWPMIIVIPAISAATFLMSWWVTTTYVEPASH